MIEITILTLFPDYFDSVLETSMLKRAQEQDAVRFQIIDLRTYALDKHKTTDDRPYGGGAGMVLMIEPIFLALQDLNLLEKNDDGQWHRKVDDGAYVVLTSAKGALFSQTIAREWKSFERLVIICGHYEGVDERVAQYLIDAEIRIGDYVLTGGEVAAAVMSDAVARLQPNVLGNESSLSGESHDKPGYFAYPQYTRPSNFNGWEVPPVLLGGNHAHIEKWREDQRKIEV